MNKKIYFKLKIFFNIGMPRQACCIKRWEQGQSFFEPRLPVCRVKLVCFFFCLLPSREAGRPRENIVALKSKNSINILL